MPIQGRKFCGILYVESDTYNVDEVLEHIKSYFDQWAYCLHDKDVNDETGSFVGGDVGEDVFQVNERKLLSLHLRGRGEERQGDEDFLNHNFLFVSSVGVCPFALRVDES